MGQGNFYDASVGGSDGRTVVPTVSVLRLRSIAATSRRKLDMRLRKNDTSCGTIGTIVLLCWKVSKVVLIFGAAIDLSGFCESCAIQSDRICYYE